MRAGIDRRDFLFAMALTPLVAAAQQVGLPATLGARLPPWQPGNLDIHHLATGRGNSTFIMMPDGTSLLIDAGASADALDVSSAPRPSAERRPGEWIARYALRQLRALNRTSLDYLLLTHLHPDHLGDVTDSSPMSAQGPYKLTGVMDVAELLPIDTVIDRAFPNYNGPPAQTAPFAQNYAAFIKSRVSRGLRVERFKVGSADQFHPRGYQDAPGTFGIRNLVANGEVWTGVGEQVKAMFPPLDTLAPADLPNENMYSAGIRLRYGDFGYFTAGDLTSYTYDGDLPWRDVLGAAARVSGPVDVATADHHGLFDGINAEVVRALRPQAWVIPSWHISQPDLLQLERMFSERLYPGPRDVFATTVMRENMLANNRLAKRMRSTDGHIVVRVAPGGQSFNIYVTDNTDEQDRIKLMTGPYTSSKKA